MALEQVDPGTCKQRKNGFIVIFRRLLQGEWDPVMHGEI